MFFLVENKLKSVTTSETRAGARRGDATRQFLCGCLFVCLWRVEQRFTSTSSSSYMRAQKIYTLRYILFLILFTALIQIADSVRFSIFSTFVPIGHEKCAVSTPPRLRLPAAAAVVVVVRRLWYNWHTARRGRGRREGPGARVHCPHTMAC